MEIIILIWIICGISAAAVANRRGGSGALWFVLGMIFGPFGVLLSFAAGEDRIRCKYCRSMISNQASRCPHCQTQFGIASTIQCGRCRYEIPAGHAFCGSCGAGVGREIPALTEHPPEMNHAGNSRKNAAIASLAIVIILGLLVSMSNWKQTDPRVQLQPLIYSK